MAPDTAYRARAGLDENGLGPQLGPLVVTGVLARLEHPRAASWLSRKAFEALASVDDSKRVMAHGNVALGEAWARALAPAACSPADVVAALSLDPPADLRSLCSEAALPQCWPARSDPFAGPSELSEAVADDMARLARAGAPLTHARTVIVCPKRLHLAKARGVSLFVSDLHAMERLALELRALSNHEADFVCGKVGGIHTYPSRFGPLAGVPWATLDEGAARSTYRVAGLGRIAFVRDADGADPLVAIASLIGKYVREVLMGHIAGFYRERDASLSDPSGYRDPVTNAFVLATSATRTALGVPDDCFLRPQNTPGIARSP